MKILLWLVLSLLPATAIAEALETTRPAVLYDSPSTQASPKSILAGRYPVKQISRITGWRKVITHSSESGWLAEEDVKKARRAVVIANRATVRNAPNDNAPPVFYAQRGVVLELLKVENKWLRVVHLDGETGYIAADAVWLNL